MVSGALLANSPVRNASREIQPHRKRILSYYRCAACLLSSLSSFLEDGVLPRGKRTRIFRAFKRVLVEEGGSKANVAVINYARYTEGHKHVIRDGRAQAPASGRAAWPIISI